MKIYTFGYQGRERKTLQLVLEQLNGKLLDIRYSPLPTYPKAQWSGKQLAETLGPRYEWVKDFGNVDYRSASKITIAHMARGVERVKELIQQGEYDALVLMCACDNALSCHRVTVVVQLNSALRPLTGQYDIQFGPELVDTLAWEEVEESLRLDQAKLL